MAVLPKELTEKFFPGLADQHEVGLGAVGVSVIEATLGCNTDTTDAQLIAGPPNTASGCDACGPIVHSLGTAPTAALVQPGGGVDHSIGAISYAVVTMDNSAVYVQARTSSQISPLGVRTRVIAIR